MMLFILDLAVKSTLLLLLTLGVTLVFRRLAPAMRHLIWSLALMGLLVLPVLTCLLPAWNVLPGWTVVANIRTQVGPAHVAAPEPMDAEPAALPAIDSGEVVPSTPVRDGRPALRLSWRDWLIVAYVLGLVIALLPVAVSMIALVRLRRRATPLTSVDWIALVDQLRRELQVRKPIALLQSSDAMMPMTWGLLRPCILLPQDAKQWSPDRRRLVLLHELAHIKRRDTRSQLGARVVCALYWPHPLVWLAARQQRAAAELACDDLVLNSATKASTYASEILDMASTLRSPKRMSTAAIAMARPSQLEHRLLAILDGSRSRRGLTRAAVCAVLAVGMATLTMLAVCRADIKMASEPAASQPASQPAVDVGKMKAYVEDFFAHNYRDVQQRETIGWGTPEVLADGNWRIRYEYYASIWGQYDIRSAEDFTFTPAGKYVGVKKFDQHRIVRVLMTSDGPVYRNAVTTWDALAAKFGDLPERGGTVVELSFAPKVSDSIYDSALARGKELVQKLNMKSLLVQGVRMKEGEQRPSENQATAATARPAVIKTFPVTDARNVDPATTEIRVTFSKDMADGSWSWVTLKSNAFPKVNGKIHYLEDKRTCVLPVQLEPNHHYKLGINSGRFKNFQDPDGRSAEPFVLEFDTGPGDGKAPATAPVDNEMIKPAQAAAEQMLKRLDAGQYGPAWEQWADFAKKQVPQKSFVSALGAARTPLGKVTERKLLSARPMTQLPGAPDGQYVVLQYHTEFENKKNAIETITPMKDADGNWRVSGYFIK